MNSATQVNALVEQMRSEGRTKTEIVIRTAEAEIGWPYVWGATGQECTSARREALIKRESEAEAAVTRRKCQILNGSKSTCDGCKWFPGGERVLIDDCQGFIKQTAKRVGISFTGGGCSSMWRADSNWAAKGTIDTLPEQLCCVFWQDQKNPSVMSHIGWYVGGGYMIHCSGEVKREKLSKRCTHWAIPKGLEGGEIPVTLPTIRRGSRGECVTLLQTKLIQRGYDVGNTGADGAYGAKTEAAVKAFQADNGLKSDGICGPATWGALESAETVLYTVTIQHIGQAVADEIVKKYGGTMIREN